MESKIYIHIGYAKAASTTLQKHLFDKHSQINYLGIYPSGNLGKDSQDKQRSIQVNTPEFKKFHYNLVILDGLDYHSSQNLKLYKQSVQPLLKSDSVNVLSNERFTSVYFCHPDLKNKAERLKEVFPEGKIIIILRNQFEIIASKYRDWPFNPKCVEIGKSVALDDWIKIALEDNQTKYLANLKYNRVVDFYQEIFGSENVGIFLFEDLVHRSLEFAQQLSEFMEIDSDEALSLLTEKHENNAVSQAYNSYRMLHRNEVIPSFVFSRLKMMVPSALKRQIMELLKKGNKKDYQINSETRFKIQNYFGESNQKLASKYGLNIDKYNYPLL